MDIHELDAYELIEERKIADVDSMGFILRHKKSGAKVAVLSNTDENKVFYISFRTPPEDACGVPHIIEHTVLCGSDKYPVKDPFVELVKGSLNTFLNAMTYPDKTVYPVASCNKKDLENLMDVYMDAVFHPNIGKFREIFMQEGWHYELESVDAPITVNGVVYNEMKGAYSSPDELLTTKIYESLFPDNTYSRNSGGHPDHIPDLTYETYLEFYRKYYHPSNSYIYLYGDMDMAERLDWMDKNYLCNYGRQESGSEIPLQKGFDTMQEVEACYPIASGDSEEKKTYLSYNKVIAPSLDKRLYQAFDILEYALINAPGAPVRQALIDAGIGEDVSGSFDSGIRQMVFSVVAKNADVSDKERFVQIIEDTLEGLVSDGINRKSLLAGINRSEFRFREADFGNYPKGLIYGLQCMDSWLYDDEKPFMHLECLGEYAALREAIEQGYFENLIKNYLLDNQHGSVVVIEPQRGLGTEEEQALKERLAAYKDTLSQEELERLVRQTAELRKYQEEPSPEEELRKIPMLTRADMRKEALPLTNIEEQLKAKEAEIPLVRHEVPTNGIDYFTLMFEAGDVAVEDIPLMGLLRSILGYVNTRSYPYAELANEINIYTGGISGSVGLYTDAGNPDQIKVRFEIHTKVLEKNLAQALALTEEILESTGVSDVKRITEIIAQTKSRLQIGMSSAGNSVAAARSLSGTSANAYYQDSIHGVRFYRAVKALDEQIRKEPEKVISQIQALMHRIFTADRLMVSFTGDEQAYRNAKEQLERFVSKLPFSGECGEQVRLPFEKKNEGFTDASKIQYVARSGNFVRHGYRYKGTLRILRMILGYDYLWINVRVKGGAYGCMNSYTRSGDSFFVSYRDPNLAQTNEIFEGIPEYLKNFEADEHDMAKYIIGTFGMIDTPLNPEAKGIRSMDAYMRGITYEQLQRERDEILSAQPEDIRSLAPLVQSVLDDKQLCVVGNENAIRQESGLFDEIQGLCD